MRAVLALAAGAMVADAGHTIINAGWSGCRPWNKCDACKGDCDSNSDCKAPFLCYQRNGNSASVPGCYRGSKQSSMDYCYLPAHTYYFGGWSFCRSSDPCNKCEGDCDGDSDCRGALSCFQRNGNGASVPGCTRGGRTRDADYCYLRPTPVPTPVPRTPTPAHTLFNGGWAYCIPKKCNECEGDCDGDGQCKGALKCLERGTQAVPNCYIGTPARDLDYCYVPTPVPTPVPRTPTPAHTLFSGGWAYCIPKKCNECEGDCDGDAQCKGALKCLERGTQAVPNCYKGTAIRDLDYCYVPVPRTPTPAHTFYNGGWDYCIAEKCNECEGDCDSDAQCKGALRCNQRGSGPVPGCFKGTPVHHVDYCYGPTPVPTPVPTSACASQDQTKACAKKIAADPTLCSDATGYWFHHCRGSCNLHAGSPCPVDAATAHKCADALGQARCARRLANHPTMCDVASPMWWRARCRGTCDFEGALPCKPVLNCANGVKNDLQCQHKIHSEPTICTKRYYHGTSGLNWWGSQCRGTCDRLGLAKCP